MKKRSCIIYILLALLLFSSCSILQSDPSGQVENQPYSFKRQNISYTGLYSGQMDKGEPQGEGRFIVSSAVPDSEESRKNGVFSEYTGSWSDGTFEGEGTLTYADGSVVSGEFLSGEYDGLMTTITTDSEYELAHYAHGVLYGLVRRYSASGALLASDYYINGESIAPIKESAKTVDYYSLFYEADDYAGKAIQLQGTIVKKLERENSSLFLIRDSAGNDYAVTSIKPDGDTRFLTPDSPLLLVGDKVSICGISTGLYNYDFTSTALEADPENSVPNAASPSASPHAMEFSYPSLRVVSAEVEGLAPFDPAAPAMDYSLFLRYGSYYKNTSYQFAGTVREIYLDSKTHSLELMVLEEGSQNSVFYVTYSYATGESLPLRGQRVEIEGVFQGSKQVLSTDAQGQLAASYYPQLAASRIVVSP